VPEADVRVNSVASGTGGVTLVAQDGDEAIFARLFAVGARRKLKIRQAAMEIGISIAEVEDLCRRRPMSHQVRRLLLRWLAREERRDVRLRRSQTAKDVVGMVGRRATMSPEERREFGSSVALMRQASGLDERTVAGLVGLSLNALASIENGQREASPRQRARLAAVLGMDSLIFRRLSERGELLADFRSGAG